MVKKRSQGGGTYEIQVDWEGVRDAIHQQVFYAVKDSAHTMEGDAKKFAPVRKIFRRITATGKKVRMPRRPLTENELAAERIIRNRMKSLTMTLRGIRPTKDTEYLRRRQGKTIFTARSATLRSFNRTPWGPATRSPYRIPRQYRAPYGLPAKGGVIHGRPRRTGRLVAYDRSINNPDVPSIVYDPGALRTLQFGQGGKGFLPSLGAHELLDARGRYELGRARADLAGSTESLIRTGKIIDLIRSNSAAYEHQDKLGNVSRGGRVTLGGRLRGEIELIEPTEHNHVIEAYVDSPTYYSKFVEYGTRHNKAQPFLRPALAYRRARFREEIARGLVRLNTKGGDFGKKLGPPR